MLLQKKKKKRRKKKKTHVFIFEILFFVTF